MNIPVRKVAIALAVTGLSIAGVSTAVAALTDSGHQKFTITTVGRGPSTVVAKGPISGEGTETNNHLTKVPGETFQSTLSYPDGAVHIDVHPGPPNVQFNPDSCVTTITERDTFNITGADGIYAGATGSGTSRLRVILEGARAATGDCAGPGTPPVSSNLLVKGKGTVSIP